jgi:hypothetical protein
VRRASAFLAGLLLAGPASAGILIEGRLEGVPLRLELALPGEPGGELVRATVAGEPLLLDLARGTIEPPRASRTRAPAGGSEVGLVQLAPLGGGATIAGHAGAWQVLTEDGRICGEVLASAWMLRFLEPAVRALELLAAHDPRFEPRARHGCSPLGFRHWTGRGWPLLVGGRSEAVFVTERIRFDHPFPPASGPDGAVPR